MALSDSSVRTLKPKEKSFKVYDRDGLFLLVNPNGSKLWRWRYRFGGKEKLMAIGEYRSDRVLIVARQKHDPVATLDDGISTEHVPGTTSARDVFAAARNAVKA